MEHAMESVAAMSSRLSAVVQPTKPAALVQDIAEGESVFGEEPAGDGRFEEEPAGKNAVQREVLTKLPEKSTYMPMVSRTGQLVSKYQFHKVRPLTYSQVVTEGYKLQWLTLQDDNNEVRAELNAEQVQIGLISALMLTVTFSYMFAIPGLPWDFIEMQWGNTNASSVNFMYRDSPTALDGKEMVKVHRDALSLLSFLSSVSYIISTVHCVLTIIKISELTGAYEPRIFQDRLGRINSAGLFFFLSGSGFLIGFLLYHFFIFCSYVTPMIVGCICVFTIVLTYLGKVQTKQQVALFQLKSQGYRNPPTTLSIEDIDHYALSFENIFGGQHCTLRNLEEFIRDNLAPNEPSSILFSEGTRQILNLVSTRVVKKFVADNINKSRIVKRQEADEYSKEAGLLDHDTRISGSVL
jgi:hypothetical protein